ncbi:MAG: methyltransferase domain-containing protein [Gallionella sp.]|jgi:ubiquinone/menaquinone biosynthesis C-methylase UbiE|nr:methyltransferase domain-containing protein [Gallionella sp.]MCK9353389.1 methyltransferase domain-containing protein [Gallionella sp.]
MTMSDLPYRQNTPLRFSYNLLAPLYDLVVSHVMRAARKRSLRALPTDAPGRVLVSGAGTGLDLPFLPPLHRYAALDFSAGMLRRAVPRATGLEVDFVLGDSMALPFSDESFDHVVLHLIVAVVPQPELCLAEAARVLKPGGAIVLFDKFLHPHQHAWLRRALTPLTRRFATRMDVVFEELLREAPELRVVSDEPMLAGGWFRCIVLRKD